MKRVSPAILILLVIIGLVWLAREPMAGSTVLTRMVIGIGFIGLLCLLFVRFVDPKMQRAILAALSVALIVILAFHIFDDSVGYKKLFSPKTTASQSGIQSEKTQSKVESKRATVHIRHITSCLLKKDRDLYRDFGLDMLKADIYKKILTPEEAQTYLEYPIGTEIFVLTHKSKWVKNKITGYTYKPGDGDANDTCVPEFEQPFEGQEPSFSFPPTFIGYSLDENLIPKIPIQALPLNSRKISIALEAFQKQVTDKIQNNNVHRSLAADLDKDGDEDFLISLVRNREDGSKEYWFGALLDQKTDAVFEIKAIPPSLQHAPVEGNTLFWSGIHFDDLTLIDYSKDNPPLLYAVSCSLEGCHGDTFQFNGDTFEYSF